MGSKYERERNYSIYFDNILTTGPQILRKFIVYITTINGVAINTASSYYRDLILLCRYVLACRGVEIDFSELTNDDYDKIVELLEPEVTDDFVKSITRDEILNFLFHLKNENENSTSARNHRLSAIKHFFEYLDSELGILDFNPAANIKSAKKEKMLPKYLTLEEAKQLLAAVPPSENYARDYCILTFFLNLGLRISELVNINMQDIKDGKLKVTGKGSKERILYLNRACKESLDNYMKPRMSEYFVKKEYMDALFVSERGRRISNERVYDIVKDCLARAGLSDKGYTPHKLRHTAATLMYQNGVDIRSLKDVLGHESIGTTQIYTHTNNELIKEATNKNPLSEN